MLFVSLFTCVVTIKLALFFNHKQNTTLDFLYSSECEILELADPFRYFLSVARVSYGRETKVRGSVSLAPEEDTPVHLLVVHGLKGAWTKHNRDVVFGLFDSYVDAKLLRRNLSTEALRGFRVDGQPLTSPELRPRQGPLSCPKGLT